ncbi:hypothetical protein NKG94_23690 [Micromonospora sp. M12]
MKYAHSGDRGRDTWYRRCPRRRVASSRRSGGRDRQCRRRPHLGPADVRTGRPTPGEDRRVGAGGGRFGQRRVVTGEGFEQTFAIYVLSRYLLAERLRPALERAPAPVILNLSGTGGIRSGRLHWDDLQFTSGYTMFRATMQGARANDLLGAASRRTTRTAPFGTCCTTRCSSTAACTAISANRFAPSSGHRPRSSGPPPRPRRPA